MPTAAFGPHTVKGWLATPEGEHWELIHGNLILTEETADNSGLAGEIERRIGNYLEQFPLGIVRHGIAFSFPGILAPEREEVVPDLCYIPNDRLEKWDGEANFQEGVVPAFVMEMLSPSTREIDWKDKVEIYREAGIGEYWIFDRHEESVRIYRFGENREKPVAIMSFEDSIPTPLLPGFSLEMPRIRQALTIGMQRSRTR